MFFSWNTSQGIHEAVNTDGSNFIIIIIKILVCVCLYAFLFTFSRSVFTGFFESSNVSLTNYSVANDVTPEMTDEISYATGEAESDDQNWHATPLLLTLPSNCSTISWGSLSYIRIWSSWLIFRVLQWMKKNSKISQFSRYLLRSWYAI